MNTPSHLIMTAAVQKAIGNRLPIVISAFLLGSVAPDIPLYALSLGAAVYFRYILGRSAPATFRHMYDYLFFHDPWWITLHNLLHSPALLLVVLTLFRFIDYRRIAWSRWCFWFLISCLIHRRLIALDTDDAGAQMVEYCLAEGLIPVRVAVN